MLFFRGRDRAKVWAKSEASNVRPRTETDPSHTVWGPMCRPLTPRSGACTNAATDFIARCTICVSCGTSGAGPPPNPCDNAMVFSPFLRRLWPSLTVGGRRPRQWEGSGGQLCLFTWRKWLQGSPRSIAMHGKDVIRSRLRTQAPRYRFWTNVLALHWFSSGAALVLHMSTTKGTTLVLYLHYTCATLARHLYSGGSALEVSAISTILVMHSYCAGIVMELCGHCTEACSVLVQHRGQCRDQALRVHYQYGQTCNTRVIPMQYQGSTTPAWCQCSPNSGPRAHISERNFGRKQLRLSCPRATTRSPKITPRS